MVEDTIWTDNVRLIMGNILPSDFGSPNTLMAGRDKGN